MPSREIFGYKKVLDSFLKRVLMGGKYNKSLLSFVSYNSV